MVIIDNEYITLLYHEAEKIVHHQVHRPFSGEPLGAALTRGCEVLEQYGSIKWLSDERMNGPMSDEDAGWARNFWNKRVLDAGWKYWALVISQDLAGSFSMKAAVDGFSKLGVTVGLYTNPDMAMKWLIKQ